jgi:tRNA (guanosine-2'-O-)-methyltransferase
MVQSLNISVACAITLYEAFRQKLLNGAYDGAPKLQEARYKQLAESWGMHE